MWRLLLSNGFQSNLLFKQIHFSFLWEIVKRKIFTDHYKVIEKELDALYVNSKYSY